MMGRDSFYLWEQEKETRQRAEKLEALVEKYRAALFCPDCRGGRLINFTMLHFGEDEGPCPTCGPIREELRGNDGQT